MLTNYRFVDLSSENEMKEERKEINSNLFSLGYFRRAFDYSIKRNHLSELFEDKI